MLLTCPAQMVFHNINQSRQQQSERGAILRFFFKVTKQARGRTKAWRQPYYRAPPSRAIRELYVWDQAVARNARSTVRMYPASRTRPIVGVSPSRLIIVSRPQSVNQW